MFKKLITKILVALGILKQVPGKEVTYEIADGEVNHPVATSKKSIKLGVIVGHEKKAQGAEFFDGKTTEYIYNTEIANIMLKISKSFDWCNLHIIYRDGVGISGAYSEAFNKNCDCVIELHCNAFNGRARGTLVYTSADKEDVEFSKIVQKFMVDVFGTDNRRVDEDYGRGVQIINKDDRGGRNVYSFNGMANCLVEPAFCDNKEDGELLLSKKEEYAKGLLNAVKIWAMRKELI